MKKSVSPRGKRNRLIATSVLLLTVGFGTSRLWQTITGKEIVAPEAQKTATKPTADTVVINATQLDVPLIEQMEEPSLFNGCEITSLAMMLNYANISVTKNELAEAIPIVDYLDADGNYGDPNDGFVGDIYGVSIGYSVYHSPIYELAKDYTNEEMVSDLTGKDFSKITEQVAAGNPVWVITTVPMAPTNDMEEWQTKNGTISISWNVHSVLVTGFDSDSIYVNDPYGEKNKQVDRDDFEAAWTQMGSQAVVVEHI